MKDRGFEIIPQEGVLHMRVWGRTLEDLFRNSVRGVAAYLKGDIFNSKRSLVAEPYAFRIQSVDIHSLLVDYLSKVIAESDIHNRIFFDARFTKFGENFLEGEFSGVPTESFDHAIQGVSYGDVDIKKNPVTGKFETLLVFEI